VRRARAHPSKGREYFTGTCHLMGDPIFHVLGVKNNQASNKKNTGAGMPIMFSSRKKVFLVTRIPLPKLRLIVE